MHRPYQAVDDLHLGGQSAPVMPYAVADAGRHAEHLVQFTVPSFEYPRSDAPANLHFAGPLSCTGFDGRPAGLVAGPGRHPARRARHPGHRRQHRL